MNRTLAAATALICSTAVVQADEPPQKGIYTCVTQIATGLDASDRVVAWEDIAPEQKGFLMKIRDKSAEEIAYCHKNYTEDKRSRDYFCAPGLIALIADNEYGEVYGTELHHGSRGVFADPPSYAFRLRADGAFKFMQFSIADVADYIMRGRCFVPPAVNVPWPPEEGGDTQ